MQTNEMLRSAKWKLVAGAATLCALGIGGLALADAETRDLPEAIRLQDLATTAETIAPVPDFVVASGNQVDLTDLDSPFLLDDSVDS